MSAITVYRARKIITLNPMQPEATHIAVRDGRIKAGQNILLEAVGGGFTWGAVLIKW